mgnify:CR=1 FL=1
MWVQPPRAAEAVQPDGKNVGASEEQSDAATRKVARLLPDGAPDPEFGSDGVVITPFPSALGSYPTPY